MRDAQNIQELIRVSPDYMGFIFYPKSKRYIGEKNSIFDDIPTKIKKIGVFVDEKPGEVKQKVRDYRLDFVQLHGSEPPEYCEDLTVSKINVIKAFQVGKKFDFSTILPYKPVCRYFLFDTKSNGHGGSGQKFDWKILQHYDNEKPFFLGGGIAPEDARIVKQLANLNIHAIDINSRFEIQPGVKDISKIKTFKQEILTN